MYKDVKEKLRGEWGCICPPSLPLQQKYLINILSTKYYSLIKTVITIAINVEILYHWLIAHAILLSMI